jgi:hypothetical protein
MSGRQSFSQMALWVIAILLALPGGNAAAQTTLRMILDWKYQAQIAVTAPAFL